MDRQGKTICPNCGAPNKYPDKTKVTHEHGYPRNRPTTYTCGTVTSPDWSPPIYGKGCIDTNKRGG